jgi:hypothetical protein
MMTLHRFALTAATKRKGQEAATFVLHAAAPLAAAKTKQYLRLEKGL